MHTSRYTTQFAWAQLMRENAPHSKKWDSGEDGILPECRSCRFHRPYWKLSTCVYEFCPYSKTPISTKRPPPTQNTKTEQEEE